MCRVNIRLDIAFYSAMKGTTGQVLRKRMTQGLVGDYFTIGS